MFFHFQYKDGCMNSWRIQQCLYMKLNCDSRVHCWRTHQYLQALKKTKNIRVSYFYLLLWSCFVFVYFFIFFIFQAKFTLGIKQSKRHYRKNRKVIPVVSVFVDVRYWVFPKRERTLCLGKPTICRVFMWRRFPALLQVTMIQ